MRLFFVVLLFSLTTNVNAWQQWPTEPIDTCKAQAPYGFPNNQKELVALCRHAYISAYDNSAKIPNWVSYTLNPENAVGCLPRSNAFKADAEVDNSATPADYAKTGYDKGHIANDGDMRFDERAEFESFLMTNMTPQLPGLNRGSWKILETNVRTWAFVLGNSFTIYAGPIYDIENSKKIGKGVVVPSAFYKIVINNNTGDYAAWLFPHESDLGKDMKKLRVPLAYVEEVTGTQFPVPTKGKELSVGAEWVAKSGTLTSSKRDMCTDN